MDRPVSYFSAWATTKMRSWGDGRDVQKLTALGPAIAAKQTNRCLFLLRLVFFRRFGNCAHDKVDKEWWDPVVFERFKALVQEEGFTIPDEYAVRIPVGQ